MCGIAGWLGHLPAAEKYSTRVVRSLHHRGPDGYGVKSWIDAALIHTRLSIIDLSPAGAQPMPNEDETVWAVLNGEIYNHHELRNELEKQGHLFRGRSDTEILPHLYEEQGWRFVHELRGMFALAIYDTKKRTLLLARDRFGIKPLFYSTSPDRLAFASEIQALLQVPGVDSRPDKQAIYDFAALFYIPAPETFYVGIRALEPGEMLKACLGGGKFNLKRKKYHEWSIAPNTGLTIDQAADRADALLTAAVQRQMESDVPLGALLSGGIDSSLVSAAAQDATNGKLRTFNVRFSDREFDETWAALDTARHIGSHHETLEMGDDQGSWERITALLLQAGQPFADSSLFAVNAVCRLMRQHVAVALSGDGGDEGFGGYDLYWQLARIDRFQKLPTSLLRRASLALNPLARLGFVQPHWPQRASEIAVADDTSIIQHLFCWMPEEEHSKLCRLEGVLPVRRFFEPKWQHHLLQSASRLERLSAHTTEVNTRLVLPNDFLFKVDIASMRESLEVRVPMLDEDLFAFGLSLPHHLKVRGRRCKMVLRGVAERRLPRKVADKPKRGFGIPVDRWVNGDFKARLRDLLLGSSSRLAEFFRPESYEPLVKAFCDGHCGRDISRQGLYQRAVMLLSVQLALDH